MMNLDLFDLRVRAWGQLYIYLDQGGAPPDWRERDDARYRYRLPPFTLIQMEVWWVQS